MFISFLFIFFFTKTSLGSIGCSERLLPGLSDDKITASSILNLKCQPAYARLNSIRGSWCKHYGDKKPYIQVKMNAMTASGIITQGFHSANYWVKSYYVKYSEDGVNWTYVKEPGVSRKVFIGNSDQNTWVTNKFNCGIRLQILRIYPINCEGFCCLRFDVIGCQIGVMTTSAMVKSVQELTTFTDEIQTTSTRPAAVVMTKTAMTDSVTKLSTFTEEIQGTSTRRATLLKTTIKFLHESTENKYMSSLKKELSTLSDVPPFTSPTSFAQSMTSLSSTNYGETLNVGNATTELHCYMMCSKNHTKQELVEMVDKLKQELKTDKKKTSMYIRSKTSASDERKSSAAIGCVGVAILCVAGIGVLLLDLPYLVQVVKYITNPTVHIKVTPAMRA